MKELMFLTETASKQVEATLAARDLSEPLSPIYAAYNSTLRRLTDTVVVQCVEYTMAMDPTADRKSLFAKAREVQTEVINTIEMATPAGQEFGLKLANRIFNEISPSSNPLSSVSAHNSQCTDQNTPAVEAEMDDHVEVINSDATQLRELIADLGKTQSKIGEILARHIGVCRPA